MCRSQREPTRERYPGSWLDRHQPSPGLACNRSIDLDPSQGQASRAFFARLARRWLEGGQSESRQVGRQVGRQAGRTISGGGKRPTGGVSRKNETERNTAAKRSEERAAKLSGSMMHGTSDSVVLLPCKLHLRSSSNLLHLLSRPHLPRSLFILAPIRSGPRTLQPDRTKISTALFLFPPCSSWFDQRLFKVIAPSLEVSSSHCSRGLGVC